MVLTYQMEAIAKIEKIFEKKRKKASFPALTVFTTE